VHRHPYYEGLGFKVGHCPEAEQYYAEAISLPMFPGISDEQQNRVVAALAAILI
jgi:dTDP-4-amino-4,6-dideoxygalactose transaminase